LVGATRGEAGNYRSPAALGAVEGIPRRPGSSSQPLRDPHEAASAPAAGPNALRNFWLGFVRMQAAAAKDEAQVVARVKCHRSQNLGRRWAARAPRRQMARPAFLALKREQTSWPGARWPSQPPSALSAPACRMRTWDSSPAHDCFLACGNWLRAQCDCDRRMPAPARAAARKRKLISKPR